ncbi:MAG: hypothetical protein OEL76_12990 [Siculibacillus sp.]|nr:hypothetical protein [Siculibacillus sp.]
MSVSELVKALAEDSPAAGRDRSRHRRPSGAEEAGDRWDRAEERRGRDDRSDIDAQLDVLADRLRGLTAGGDPSPRPRARIRDEANSATLAEIAAAVDRLGRQIPEPAPRRPTKARPQTDVAAVLAALDGLDRRVKAMSEERGAITVRGRSERGGIADLDRAVAEIAQHQTSLEREKRPRRNAGSDIERHFRELSEKIEQLRGRDNSPEALIDEIRSLRQFVEQRAGGVDVGDEIRKLAGRIDQMASQNPTASSLEPLMTEMSRLRDVVLQSDVEGSLKSLEAGYGHIVDRLDDLKRGLASPRVGKSVDAEISEIHNLLRAVPQVSQFSSIEQSLRDLADKIEHLAGEEEAKGTVRLEKRFAELKSQIDRVDPSSVVKALDQRLKLVTDKLEAIEKAARGPISPDRVASLLDDMRAVAAGSGTAEELRALEARLAELTERISDLDRRRPS